MTGRRALAALLLVCGCRAYAPVSGPSLAAGREVRVRLTDAGSVELASRIGPRAESLEGTVAAQDDSSITLVTTTVTRRDRDEERWPGEHLTLRRTQVDGVDAVRTSSVRTAFLVGSTVALLAVVRAAMSGGETIVRTTGAGGQGSK